MTSAFKFVTNQERNDEIREFVLDNYPPASSWEPKHVDEYAAWAASEGFLYLCYDEPGDKGKLVGLTMARPLSIGRIGNEVSDTEFDRDGPTIFVDITISRAGKPAMQAMMKAILDRMGSKPVIAFKRLRTKDKVKVYSTGDFANRLLGKQ